MKNPYQILGFDPLQTPQSVTDEQVQARYLALVQKFPPDRFPQRFEATRSAFEQLKTLKLRVSHGLFDTTLPDRDDLVDALLGDQNMLQRPSLQQVQNLLKLRKTP